MAGNGSASFSLSRAYNRFPPGLIVPRTHYSYARMSGRLAGDGQGHLDGGRRGTMVILSGSSSAGTIVVLSKKIPEATAELLHSYTHLGGKIGRGFGGGGKKRTVRSKKNTSFSYWLNACTHAWRTFNFWSAVYLGMKLCEMATV